MDNSRPTLVWLRRDLRLHDNSALSEACESGRPVIPVYIHAPEEEAPWQPGGASEWWRHCSLESLIKDLHKHRSRLIIRRGPSLETLRELVRVTNASAVYWNRMYMPATIERDKKIKQALSDDGIDVKSFAGALLFEPEYVRNKSGEPFKVYTPFWKHVSSIDDPPTPLPVPSCRKPGSWPDSLELEKLELLPKIDWAAGLRESWKPGETGAHERLEEFMCGTMAGYDKERDLPYKVGTSRLSPHLHFGEITPRTIWHQVKRHAMKHHIGNKNSVRRYLMEVVWREFSHHLLYHFPHTTDEPLRPEFNHFPWATDSDKLRAWQRGQTGYPIVDAGMRELWHTGWMHNRVRMVVASFLVKHLRINWTEGARWFWDTLVDADLANNTMGWQWSAGCGADAAPYFRVFNPILQGEKFDPDGEYTRRWVPELAQLPRKYLHKPWEAPTSVLADAGVDLGGDYPEPIVEHQEARQRALAAFEKIKKNK